MRPFYHIIYLNSSQRFNFEGLRRLIIFLKSCYFCCILIFGNGKLVSPAKIIHYIYLVYIVYLTYGLITQFHMKNKHTAASVIDVNDFHYI